MPYRALLPAILLFVATPHMLPAKPNQLGAQAVAQPLITQKIDEKQRTPLAGNTYPLTRVAIDRGPAPDSLPMERMTLVLQRSAQQESTLQAFLDAQQTKGSPSYHQWLTPQQFGLQFGPADSDLVAIQSWLRAHGFQINSIARGRISIEFSGTAAQVAEAFHTSIHKFDLNGEAHWANTTDPSIPTALAPAVKGVLTLHNFPRHANFTLHTPPATAIPPMLAKKPSGTPLFTFTSNNNTYYGLGPADFAAIYNVLPLWNAGVDGTGQTIAIVGETNIHLSDIEDFRNLFGLPAKDPVVILNGPDPGVVGDEPEAVLDVSWSGAVAKNATIDLVASATTETALGVDLSALYIVDNNLAPVMSESYGICEATLGNTGNAFYNALWQQAAAQGITVVIAAGDGGSAGCDDFDTQQYAIGGLAVSGFASTPYNVAVGGTDFDQTSANASKYWSATNNSTTGASALGYIPETTWNQSCAALGPGNCPSSSTNLDIVGGSGGPSSCSSQDSNGICLSGYSQPAWQTGKGVPPNGARNMPDVSMFASAGFNGSFYIMCEADQGIFGSQEQCNLANDTFVGIGGTSAAAPVFAGIMTLVNQKQASLNQTARQGNANYILYKLAAQAGASCNSSTSPATGSACVFHDITKGNNSVPCISGSSNCALDSASSAGILVDPAHPTVPAWTTTTGYDLATGLGSVDAANLVNAWSSATFVPTATTLNSLTPISVAHGQPVTISATVSPKSGSGTPTGSIALMAAPGGASLGIESFPLTNGEASGTTALLPGGTYNVTAHYPGDSTFGASDSAPVQITVGKESSTASLVLNAFDSADGWQLAPTITVPYGSLLLLRANIAGPPGTPCAPNPTQTGVACPTGSVALTANGKTLDAGTHTLNSLGYSEDQALSVDLNALGAFTLQAKYAGDSSYDASTGSLTATVVQAPSFMDAVQGGGLNITINGDGTYTYYAFAGQQFAVYAAAGTGSVLQAPTGTISILQNGSAPSGPVTLSPNAGSFPGNLNQLYQFAYLGGSIAPVLNNPGTYTYTASYSGDAFYQGAQATTPFAVSVVDTTFNLTTPISGVTVTAGKTGVTTLTLTGVDHFNGQITITCTLPAAMTLASCPTVMTNLTSPSTTAQLAINTSAPSTVAMRQNSGAPLIGAGVLACLLVFFVPGGWRRRLPIAVLLLGCVAGVGGCGVNNNSTPITVPGTPAGTYTVNVSASAYNITRTGTFTVTVQ